MGHQLDIKDFLELGVNVNYYLKKREIKISFGSLKLVSFNEVGQLAKFRNSYAFDLTQSRKIVELGLYLIFEWNLRVILGYFKVKKSSSSENSLAQQLFDKTSIQRLKISLLGIYDFKVQESAWPRLGIRTALKQGKPTCF
jgi:hypothetical protein